VWRCDIPPVYYLPIFNMILVKLRNLLAMQK
jgi:hypothetical protein